MIERTLERAEAGSRSGAREGRSACDVNTRSFNTCRHRHRTITRRPPVEMDSIRASKHEPHSRSSTRSGRTRPPFRRPRDSGRAGRRGACGARCRVGRRPRRSGRFCQDHDLPPDAQHDQSVPPDHRQSKRRAERPPRWSSPPEWLHQPGRVRLDLQLRAQQVLGRHHPRRHQWRIRLQRHQHRRTQLDRGRPGDLLQRPMRWPVGARILRRRDRRRHPPTGDHR